MKFDLYQSENLTIRSDILERLRLVNNFTDENWLDILKLTWADYALIKAGSKNIPKKSILNLAECLDETPQSLINGSVNFKSMQIRSESKNWQIPRQYSYGRHGRSRTTITTFDYLERYHGWRLRYDILKAFDLNESMLTDPFSSISMRLITDVTSHLAKRQFNSGDFFKMGMYSFNGNVETKLGQFYSRLNTPREVLEHMWSECLKFYESNCIYNFLKLNNDEAVLEVLSDPFVAEELGVRHLGNQNICDLKAGIIASAPLYIGYPTAAVTQKSCVHKGDSACVYSVTFPEASQKIMLPKVQNTEFAFSQNECGCSKPHSTDVPSLLADH